jgi:hypothetical protein
VWTGRKALNLSDAQARAILVEYTAKWVIHDKGKTQLIAIKGHCRWPIARLDEGDDLKVCA